VDAGASCSGHFSAGSREELLRQVADHLQRKHKVKNVTQTILNLVDKLAR
jgi:predicted small metal-binding protein